MNKKRVVVTGLGVVSSVGTGKDIFWDAILRGRSGISRVSSFDTKDFRCHYAGEIKNFKAEEYISKRKMRFMGRTSHLAVTATTLALDDAKISLKNIDRKKTGVFIGTTMGEKPMEDSLETWFQEGHKNIKKEDILLSSANNIPENIAIHFNFNGPNYLIPTACAAGNYAIGYAYDLIRQGDIQYAVAGGADSFSKIAYSGFHRLYAMSPDLCRPFDKNRKGMLVGEGAGILFLESLESALQRNAGIYSEITGYGLSCDAHHITAPHPHGISKAILKALKEAGIKEYEVDYICAHGTGTKNNDAAECAAIRSVFKDQTSQIAVSSIKSMLGHPMGAASAIEAIACCLAVKEDKIPPTINFETPDPKCNIDCIPNRGQKRRVRTALNNGFAFGGNNSCLVVRKFN